MAKTPSSAEILQAEIAALRLDDEARLKRVRRIEVLQLPIAAEVAEVLRAKTVVEAAVLLPDLAANLTDNMQAVINNLVSQIGYALTVMESEVQRIEAQVEADAQAEAETGK
ncbi:hypothetical protein D3C71_346940 [compost metagenome]|jgi:hypothetical protein